MNPQLHHMWNAVRTPDREASKPGPIIPKEVENKNKLSLRQNKPR